MVQGRTSTWNGIAQSLLSLQPDQTYNVSAWVRLVNGSSQTVQLTVKKTDGNGTTYAAAASGTVTTNGWLQLAGEYDLTVSGSLTELTLYIEVPSSSTASYFIDDLLVESPASPPLTNSGEATVNWTDVRQVIDGFGASSAWRPNWSTALAEMFFSTNSGTGFARDGASYSYTGVGLSLLRTRIAPGGTTVENSLMQMAQARGARVWSAPWSPSTPFKSNGNVNGGSFVGNPANYQAYANQLAAYVVSMKNQYGVNLYALSVQNEPDANVTTYESCNWTAQQIHDFIPYLSSALTASNVGATKIMLPESQNWTDPQGLRLTTLNDPAVAPFVSIIANHNYVANNAAGDQATPVAVDAAGKVLWETEVAKLSGNDSSINDGLYWAGRVHLFLTSAQANAWHYWWLCSGSTTTSNEGLCDTNDVPAKRMYTLGNFSRFVRPGYYRIEVTNNTGPLRISAYKNLTNRNFAIVAINSTSTNVTQAFNLNGFSVSGSVIPWLTSASASLAVQSGISTSGSVFTSTVPAMSVVTFTGQAANSPPSLAVVPNATINAGVTLIVTNVATDADAPPQTLQFSLVSSNPTNAVLNATNGMFTWRPMVSQAGTTNVIIVRVQDSGAPALSATNSFTVAVNPVSQPQMLSIEFGGGGVNMLVSGATGPDYTLLTSTNLISWQPLVTTNPVTMPFSLSDTNNADAARFYRLRLGP